MRMALALWGVLAACGGDSFVGNDAACPRCVDDAASDAVDDVDAQALSDVGSDVDASLDVADAAIACALSKPPPNSASDSCELTNDPNCVAPCEVDGAVASFGIACADDFTSTGHNPPPWLASTCLTSPFEAGANKVAFCCAKSACVRRKLNDSSCANDAAPYAWDCPAGPTVVLDASGYDHCGCGTGPCSTCCDIKWP